MFDGLSYAALYGFILAFAIGPIFFTLIETSITKGFKAAVFFDLGALSADVFFIVIAYFSTSQNFKTRKRRPRVTGFWRCYINSIWYHFLHKNG